MVWGNVGVGAAQHLVTMEPFHVQWSQHANQIHVIFGIEDVVYNSLEVVPAERKTECILILLDEQSA